MITIGSTLVYGAQVCNVQDIREETFGKNTKKYYVLSPVYDDRNVIYVPADNPALTARIKPLLTAEEMKALMQDIHRLTSVWVDDDKERLSRYKEALEKDDREEILRIFKTLSDHKQQLEQKGRHLYSADEMILQRAEKVLCDEFSVVLGIRREEVVPLILREMEPAGK